MLRKERGKKYCSIMPYILKGIINKNAMVIKKSEKYAVFLSPNILISVFVPAFLSALASRMSFVDVPPKRNNAEIKPIDSGRFSNGLEKTAHEAITPRNPREVATQS
jgi:hypothetical protein